MAITCMPSQSQWLQPDLQPLKKITKTALVIIAHVKHTLANQPAEVS